MLLLFLTLASIRLDNLGKWSKVLLIIAGVSAAIILPLIYLYEWNLMNPSQLVHTSRGDVGSTTNFEMLKYTMGYGIRAIFLLTCVGASFLFIKDKELRYSYRNFLIIFFLLLLIPWSWRWLWVTPVPVLASVAVGGALAQIRRHSNSVVALGTFLVIAFGFTAASSRRVLSEENYTSIRWPNAKLDGHYVYLKPYHKAARIKNGTLHLDGYDTDF
jgi:hypothetical protein